MNLSHKIEQEGTKQEAQPDKNPSISPETIQRQKDILAILDYAAKTLSKE